MSRIRSEVHRLEDSALQDLHAKGERLIPGVAYFQDNFPALTKEISRFGTTVSKRIRNNRGATGRGFKSRSNIFGRDKASRARALKSHLRSLNRGNLTQVQRMQLDFAEPQSAERKRPSTRFRGRVEPKRTRFEPAQQAKRARVSVPEFAEFNPVETGASAPQSRRANMPHTLAQRRRQRETHSRNIKSNVGFGRPMRTTALIPRYAEVKHVQADGALATPVSEQISVITQGTTNSTRTGDQIKGMTLSLLCDVGVPTDSIATSVHSWRITIFQWLGDSVDAPVTADLFVASPTTDVSKWFFNTPRKQQFIILSDTSGLLSGTATPLVIGSNQTGTMRISVNMRRPIMDYLGVATTGTNQLYVMFNSQSTGGGVSGNPFLNYGYKFTFVDS